MAMDEWNCCDGEDHDGPKTDHDGQQGDGYGLSLAPDPRAQKGAGHCGPDMHKKQTGKGHAAAKPKQTGAGKPSYRAFVAAEMRKNGGNLKDAAAKWARMTGVKKRQTTSRLSSPLAHSFHSHIVKNNRLPSVQNLTTSSNRHAGRPLLVRLRHGASFYTASHNVPKF